MRKLYRQKVVVELSLDEEFTEKDAVWIIKRAIGDVQSPSIRNLLRRIVVKEFSRVFGAELKKVS